MRHYCLLKMRHYCLLMLEKCTIPHSTHPPGHASVSASMCVRSERFCTSKSIGSLQLRTRPRVHAQRLCSVHPKTCAELTLLHASEDSHMEPAVPLAPIGFWVECTVLRARYAHSHNAQCRTLTRVILSTPKCMIPCTPYDSCVCRCVPICELPRDHRHAQSLPASVLSKSAAVCLQN